MAWLETFEVSPPVPYRCMVDDRMCTCLIPICIYYAAPSVPAHHKRVLSLRGRHSFIFIVKCNDRLEALHLGVEKASA